MNLTETEKKIISKQQGESLVELLTRLELVPIHLRKDQEGWEMYDPSEAFPAASELIVISCPSPENRRYCITWYWNWKDHYTYVMSSGDDFGPTLVACLSLYQHDRGSSTCFVLPKRRQINDQNQKSPQEVSSPSVL